MRGLCLPEDPSPHSKLWGLVVPGKKLPWAENFRTARGKPDRGGLGFNLLPLRATPDGTPTFQPAICFVTPGVFRQSRCRSSPM
jgi:hypothetical protein